MNLYFSPMAPQDLPVLAELEKCCFSAPWSQAALAEELDNPNAFFLVSKTETDEIVGYVGLHLVKPEAYMDNLAVFPAFRRRGVARRLLQEVRLYAEQNGFTRITLEVRESNAAAQSLYLSLGFVQDGKRPRFYQSPQEDALLFSLYL